MILSNNRRYWSGARLISSCSANSYWAFAAAQRPTINANLLLWRHSYAITQRTAGRGRLLARVRGVPNERRLVVARSGEIPWRARHSSNRLSVGFATVL